PLPRRRLAPAGTLPDRTRWLRRRLVSPLYMAPRGWLTSVLRRYAKTKNSEGDAVSSPSEPRLFSHLEFPRSVGAGDRRSHLNVDRLPPGLLRVGKPRRRVLERRLHGPRRFRLGHGDALLRAAGRLGPALGQRCQCRLDLHILLRTIQASNQPATIMAE